MSAGPVYISGGVPGGVPANHLARVGRVHHPLAPHYLSHSLSVASVSEIQQEVSFYGAFQYGQTGGRIPDPVKKTKN